jgi:exopolysaccharide biosynthesis protein
MGFSRIFRVCAVPAALLMLCLQAGAAEGPCKEGFKSESSKVQDGIRLIEHQCDDPLYRAFIVEIDLTRKSFGFFVTPYKMRRKATSEFAGKIDALVAVNGGFWEEQGGFTVSAGERWPKWGDTDSSTVIGFGGYEDGKRKVDIRPTKEVLGKTPDWMRHALTGIPMALEKGEPVKSLDKNVWKHRHPRTALGLSKSGDTFFMAAVDGRQGGWSWGLNTYQLGQLFRQVGAYEALNLDGGGSTTMVIPSLGGVVNRPCPRKGDERKVPNHLALIDLGKAASQKEIAKIFLSFLSGNLPG